MKKILLTLSLLLGVFFVVLPKVQEVQAAACAAPSITLAAGTYTGVQTSTITAACSTICYTIDGTTPTAASNACTGATLTYSSAITIDHSLTIKAVAISATKTISSVASKAYTIVIDTPTFGTNGGSFNNDTSTTILDGFVGATICYTTDGSTPGATTPGTCNSSPTQTYSGAVSVTATGTVLKAIATKSGSTNSAVATSNAFTLTVGVVSSSPGAGTYSTAQSVTLNIATTTGATIHYTTDGSAVTCSSGTYSGAFGVLSTTTVKAIGCKTNYVSDTPISDLYTIAVISISITSDGAVSYGFVAPGGQKSTIDLSDTQIVKNDGNVAEDFTIKTSNATGGTVWNLGASAGSDTFVHEFSINGGGAWTKFTTADSYQSFVGNIAANGTQNFDLRITAPTSSSDYVQKTITVTILASQH